MILQILFLSLHREYLNNNVKLQKNYLYGK